MTDPCTHCAALACHHCDGTTWDTERDERAVCPCWAVGHEKED